MSKFKSRIAALAEFVGRLEYSQATGCSLIIDGVSTPEEIERARARRTRVPLIHISFVAPPAQYELTMHEPSGRACRWESPTPEEPGDHLDAALQGAVDDAYKRAAPVTGALPEVNAKNDNAVESRD